MGMPVDTSRRIRTARLRGESEAVIRRGALLLEDALRIASLSGIEQGRLLLIRSLSLGALRLDKSAAFAAHQLEQQIAELARHAVHGADPRGSGAQAVYFHDRLDAVIVLIQRLARGTSGDGVRAWYWRQAVPGWQPDLTPEQTGRLLLGVLLNLSYGVQSLAQAIQRLVEARCLDGVLHAVREQDGPVLLQQCGWRATGHAMAAVSVRSAMVRPLPFPRTWQSVLSQWVTRWGPSDLRSLWLVALAVQSRQSETTHSAEILAQAEAVLKTIVDSAGALPSSPDPSERTVAYGDGEPSLLVQTKEPAIPENAGWSECASVYTVYAGFWFLIPLLMRAGFGRAVEDHPEWIDAAVPQRLLRSLADRLAIPPDDPVQLWLSHEAADESGGAESDRDTELVSAVETVVTAWRISMRRWCRLKAHLGLADVVRRPGWVSWSKTHVEVRMPLNDVDLRVRRAGLDLDPGWVPWLGRVIRFYYEAERRPHGAGGIAGH